MTNFLDILESVDPLDWPEFNVWNLEMDIKECCYLIQQIKCLLRNSELND